MFSFENYLFALLAVLVPIFIYFSFFYKKYPTNANYLIFGLLCGLSIIISMSYPFELASGHVYDLRTIPWLIAFLYGGGRMGLFATALIFIYRSVIGIDEGLFITLVAYTISAITVTLYLGRFKIGELRKRIKISVFLTLHAVVLVIFGLLLFIEISYSQLNVFISYFILSNLVTIILVVYIIETLQEKEKNKTRIQQSERVRLVGEMAASVAHEIKNPLTVVMGFTQILKSDSNLTERQRSSLELIDSELKRAEKIIYDYLSLAKTKEKDVEDIDIIDVIGNVVEVTRYHAQHNGVEIENNTHGSYFVKANKNELTQVFLNIMKNGIEACDEEKGYLELNSRILGKYIEINITDNGKGMSEEQICQLGTPYFSTKEDGTGLGMMVCFKIIDNLKGEIKVNSRLGKGTTFAITLPLSK